ncbi:MAG: ABC transporter permease [Isosphaeraceae bacterium]|nr:ABC transporter permease [Isosphaeraceae bacterium]
MLLSKARAFIERDFVVESSYKAAFAFESLRSLFPLFSFYYVSQLVARSPLSSRFADDGGYFPFVVVGVALSTYFMHAVHSFGGIVRRTQAVGCLEAVLSTRTSPQTVILLSPLYSFCSKTLHIVLIFVVGGLVLDVDFRRCNYVSAVATLGLAVAAFSGLGILSAALIVVLKKSDPIEWVMGSTLSLLSGAYFPVSLLPQWVRPLAACSPMTHALNAMRLAVLQGYSVSRLGRELTSLGATAVVLIPIGVYCFGKAVEKGRRDGTLLDH